MTATRLNKNTRRIAILTQGMSADGGGVPTVARWLSSGLRAAGYSVDVHDLATSRRDPHSRLISKPRTWLRKTLRAPFDPTSDIHAWGANGVEFEPLRYRRRTELTAALREYDLVQVVAGGPALACVALGVGRPVYLQAATRVRWEREALHAAAPIGRRLWSEVMTAWTSRLERKALRAVDGVFVENPQMQQFVQQAGQDNVWLAQPGVDTDTFRPSDTGWSPSGYLLTVCRLADARKRLDRLIDAYALLVDAKAGIPPLVLAGRGALPSGLTALIDRRGLASRVRVFNDVPSAKLPELYRGASVFIQTSAEEGLGMSSIEAMASGVPVIATDTAGARACVIDAVTGFIVDQTDESSVAIEVSSRTLDILGQLGREMAINARSVALDHFEGARALQQFINNYERELSRPLVG